MIKRAISLFIVIALSFSFGALSVGALTPEEAWRMHEICDSLLSDDLYNSLTDEEENALMREYDEIVSSDEGIPVLIDLLAGKTSSFFKYLRNEWIPQYEASGGQGTTEGYSDPNMNEYQFYIHGRSQPYYQEFETYTYFNLETVPYIITDPSNPFIRVPKSAKVVEIHSDGSKAESYYHVGGNFYVYYLSKIYDHNVPLSYPYTDAGQAAEEEYGDLYQEPGTNNNFDPSLLTPEELIELLEDAAEDYVIEHPDYTTPEGLLLSILLLLQKAQDKGLDDDTLPTLADKLSCQCPTAAEINAAILKIMGKDEKTLTDVIDVLLEVRDGVVNIDETLKKLGVISFADMETMSIDFLPNAPSIAETLIAKLSELKGVDEFLTISSALREFQDTITNPGGVPHDISIDLEFIGAGDVSIFQASDFMEGGKFYDGLTIAKSILSVFILGFWLNLMRKKFVYLFETAGNT
jgi:hypothetical protein